MKRPEISIAVLKAFNTFNSLFVWLVVMLMANIGISQNPIVESLTISQSNGSVYISCVIGSGNTCNGIVLYRSSDSISFSAIDKILGVCGDISKPVQYTFTDNDPVQNSKNYYKLELGGFGFTEIISVEIVDLRQAGYQIRPNPADQAVLIYFENANRRRNSIKLITAGGQIILDTATEENYFSIDLGDFASGIYVFMIINEAGKVKNSGKFVVKH